MALNMINIDEFNETAAALKETTPEDTDEMSLICAEIAAARDAEDQLVKAEKAACAELEKQLALLREPYRLQRAAVAGVVQAATGALVRRLEADEAAALAALKQGTAMPAPRDMPKGLRTTRKTVLAGVDMSKLPSEYHAIVADTDHILRDAEAGLAVPGTVVEIVLGAIYKRPTK